MTIISALQLVQLYTLSIFQAPHKSQTIKYMSTLYIGMAMSMPIPLFQFEYEVDLKFDSFT